MISLMFRHDNSRAIAGARGKHIPAPRSHSENRALSRSHGSRGNPHHRRVGVRASSVSVNASASMQGGRNDGSGHFTPRTFDQPRFHKRSYFRDKSGTSTLGNDGSGHLAPRPLISHAFVPPSRD